MQTGGVGHRFRDPLVLGNLLGAGPLREHYTTEVFYHNLPYPRYTFCWQP